MPRTDTIIQAEIDKNAALIQRALERGGLPTEAEAVEAHRSLADVLERLEAITGRIEGVARSDMGEDLPFEVSLEQIGVVGMLAADVEREITTLTRLAEQIRGRVSELSAIRAEQQFRRRLML
jgi:hypothetical protein